MSLYVAIDIGCIECGEATRILGIFHDRSRAEEVAIAHSVWQRAHWTGEHRFKVFEIEKLEDPLPVPSSGKDRE